LHPPIDAARYGRQRRRGLPVRSWRIQRIADCAAGMRRELGATRGHTLEPRPTDSDRPTSAAPMKKPARGRFGGSPATT
jgi:hypothetical protein